MSNQATVLIPTTSGSKYLQQLCKHWAHKLEVEFTPEHGVIHFPKDIKGAQWSDDAAATLDAAPDALRITINASSPEHLAAMEDVLARHLDRFAFRELPITYDWQPA